MVELEFAWTIVNIHAIYIKQFYKNNETQISF